MKPGVAFVAGVIAGLAMALAMVIGWLTGTLRLDAPMLLGSFITGDLSVATWAFGFLIHLLICGVVALVYAGIFEAVKRSAWWLGVVIAAVNWVVSGFLLPLLVFIHPLVPGVITGPGAFAFNYGAADMLWFFGLHLLYGAIVGGLYAMAPALVWESSSARPDPAPHEQAIAIGPDQPDSGR